MKKIIFILCAFISVSTRLLAIDTPNSVSRFYSSLKSLGNATSVNAANTAQQTMAACFIASDQSGINLSMDGLGEMNSSLYTMRLFKMIYSQKKLSINGYDINKTEIIEQPDQSASMQRNSAQHYVTYVTKRYVKDGKTISYNDLVFTLINNGLIVEMKNAEGTSNNVLPSPKPTEELGIEQLRARAAYYYSKGKHKEAYNYYEQLVKRAPKDGDAAYRIALMTFWRKGCKDRFNRKTAKTKAKEYLNIARNYGSQEIKNKAENVSANWDNNNVYF